MHTLTVNIGRVHLELEAALPGTYCNTECVIKLQMDCLCYENCIFQLKGGSTLAILQNVLCHNKVMSSKV